MVPQSLYIRQHPKAALSSSYFTIFRGRTILYSGFLCIITASFRYFLSMHHKCSINLTKLKQKWSVIANMAFILHKCKCSSWTVKLIQQPQEGSDIIGLIFLHKIIYNGRRSSFFAKCLSLSALMRREIPLFSSYCHVCVCVISPLCTAGLQEVVQILHNIKVHRPGR